MAEVIGLASGLLTLSTFALQSSTTLYQTIQSFQSHPKRVRDLEDELKALNGVLNTLATTIRTTTDVDLSALDHPLLLCGKACSEFQKELINCSSRSGGNRTSFRDWNKLRNLGDDIDGFRQRLASYKATINIALTDVNLRKSAVNAQSLQSYKTQIQTATDDLEERLEAIDEKLEKALAHTATDTETVDLRRIKEERLSTQKCLQICAQLSQYIDQIQPRPVQNSGSSSLESEVPSETITSRGLQECKDNLYQTTARLERRMEGLFDQLAAKMKTGLTEDESSDLARLREEWMTARRCIDICSKADEHLKEKISVIDNDAVGDETIQFLVSTSDKTIHAKNRGHGFRIRQIGGHLSDESLQQLSLDISRISLPIGRHEDPDPENFRSSTKIALDTGSYQDKKPTPEPVEPNRPTKLDEIRQNSSLKRSGSGL